MLSTITISHGKDTRALVLLPGAPARDLSEAMTASFGLPSATTVAVKDQSGQVHSLEEVSRNPSKFSKARYQLHVSAAVAPPTSRTLAPGSLANVDPRALVRLFRENAPSGFLNRPAFVQIFAKLAKNVDTAAVTALFDAFDSDGNGVIDTNEFVAGAVVLCGGDRDLKIRLSFEILDRNEDGVLDRGEMEAYMTSVFRVVQHSNPAVFARHNITPDALAVVTVDSAMTYADSNQDGVISFPEFRAWMLESDPTMASKAPSAQGKPAASKRASAPPQGLGSLEQIRAETGLGELTADDVIDAFLSESDERGVVDLGGFKRALDSIMQRAGRDPAKQRPGMAEALFKAVDSDGSGGCDIEELGSAFSVLCAGSRDDRCMAAFEMWDEDGDGFLDAHEMGKLLTSVYKVLYASNPSVEREMGVSAEELGRITAHDAIEQLDTDGDGRLNFSEFRAWYSKPMQPLRGSAEEAKPKDGSWVSLEETRRLTGLGRFNPAVVMEAFAVVADDEGMVSHADFVDTLRHLAPRGLSRQDVTRAEQVRERLFQLYAEGDRVDFSVLASALAMLSGGQAEDKKRAVFELIDVDLNGTVEREEFLRFMQSTMRVLYETQPGTRERIGVGPDDLAEIVTEDAFNRYDWNKDGRLTYDEFSAYWEAEGAEAIPEQVTLEATRELLGIDRYHVDDVFEMVAAAADHDGWISLRSFTKVMSDMARHGRQLTPEQDAQLNRTLARLYESFDTDRSGSVDFQELAAGLSVLGGGSRDARAEAAFRLFDPEGRGSITLKAMEDYLTAVFKTMIEVGGEDVKRRVNGASAEELAKATAEAVFTEADLNSDGTISYSEWQRFYSNESGQALESVMHEAPSHISIAEVKQRTGLDRMTAAECFEHFARAADEHGELSKAAFVSVFAHIAPLPHDARLSLCIDRLFQVLDANGDEKVDYVELSSGLSVLTGGSQKEKLASTFSLLDVDGNGTIDLSELERYILSVYRVMYAEPGTQERMGGISVDELARMTAEEVMVSANLTQSGELTLEEFEKWIESDGSQLAEPAVRLATDKTWMTIPEMARLTNLRSYTSEELFKRFQKASNARGELSRQAFSAVVHLIMADGPRLDTGDALKAEMAVDRLFDALDVNHDKTVDITELSAGISVLAGGSRDAKVRSAFKLYDTDGNGFISPQEMYAYLLSVYRVLFETQPHVRESMGGVTAEELALVTTEEAFAQADTNGDGQLSFEEFQAWYSADDAVEQSKPGAAAAKPAAKPAAGKPAARKPAAPSVVLDDDLDVIRQVTGLGAMHSSEAFALVSSYADRASKDLSQQQFSAAIRSVAPGTRNAAERDRLSQITQALFAAMDKNGDGRVDLRELAAGLTFLAMPTHAADSSSSLFSIFSKDGKAVRYGDFEVMLESIFRTMLVTDPEARAIARERTPEELAKVTAKAIVAEADVNHDGKVTREEFDAYIANTESGRALRHLIRAEQQVSLQALGLDGVRKLTGLGRLRATQVFEVVAEVCEMQEGDLDRAAFTSVLEALAPRDVDRGMLGFVGNALFDAVDVDASNSVSFDEMSAALSILCAGDKQQKASDFFALYDLDGDGYVSFDELFFYLRSVFRLMAALQGGGGQEGEKDMDLVARALAKEIMEQADVSGDGLISLEEFQLWMQALGSEPRPLVAASGRAPPRAWGKGSPVSDLTDARAVLGLDGLGAEDVFDALARRANANGELSFEAFSQVLVEFAQKRGDASRAPGLIQLLFKKLDLDGNGMLDFSEVASGMSILAGGDTMSKLRAAHALFDLSGDGMISEHEMVTYLTSVFSVVLATQPGAAASVPGVSPEQLARATAEEAFAHADLNHDGLLDFNEFAAWVLGDSSGAVTRRIVDEAPAKLTLSDIRRITGLERYHPRTVFEALAVHSNEHGELSRSAFMSAFTSFSKKNMSEKDQMALRVTVGRIFDLFDEDKNGMVSFAELASGLSVLCSGTRQEKTAAAFSAFGNGDALSMRECQQLLTSVFRVLLDTVPGAKERVGAGAQELAQATTEEMFTNVGENGYISLEQFQQFFESGMGSAFG